MYKTKNFFFVLFDIYLNKISLNILLVSFFLIWIFEWIFIFEYSLSYISYTYLFFPYRLPLLLLICFLYFTYIWGISNWKRTQYGKFTRGDRKLWFKGFASFWFIEITTLLGVLLCAAWMNWGPKPLFPRNFFVSRKSFIIEITFFTYIIWILYLMRFSLKFNKFKTQIFLTSLILFLISLIIWRDILILYGRENINLKNSSRWRHIKTVTVIHSIFPSWWMNRFINKNKLVDKNSLFFSLNEFLKNSSIDINNIFLKDINLSDYEKYMFLPITNIKNWFNNSLQFYYLFDLKKNFFFLNKKSYYNYNFENFSIDSYLYYPRKIGFSTKKLAIWTFFFFLKIWHHLMLFIWWFFYLIRLNSRKKNSYSWLSICHFNVYCCFLISLTIFIFGYFPWYELIFKINKPKHIMISILKINGRIHWGVDYVISTISQFIYFSSYISSWLILWEYTWHSAIRTFFVFYFYYHETYEFQFEALFIKENLYKYQFLY